MKNNFKFVTAGLMVFALALIVVNQTSAEDENTEAKVITLESQMSQLIESQNNLTLALQNALLPKDQFKAPDQEPQQLGGDGTKLPPSYLCTSDYLEWPSSDTYKETEWAMEDMYPTGGQNTSYFSDINGDGLVDYYFLDVASGRRTCVQLNNGQGWDLVHKCMAKSVNNVWTFYGDCAKTD